MVLVQLKARTPPLNQRPVQRGRVQPLSSNDAIGPSCVSIPQDLAVTMKIGITCIRLLIVAVSAVASAGFAAHAQVRTDETQLGPNNHSFALKVRGLTRSYIVHVPSGYVETKPVPVVIMFHGGGGNARGAMRETGWTQKADREGFLAVFPEATPPDPTKPSRFGTNGQAWNDGSGGFHSGEKDIPDVPFIDAMLDDLITRFAVDHRRIYATGFSNGASMAFRIGVDLSTRIAAIAPVAGSLWLTEPKLARPVPLFYITGDADPLNPIEGGTPKMATGATIRATVSRVKRPASEFVTTWASTLGCLSAPKAESAAPGVTTFVYSGGRDGSEVRFTVIEGHGHIWPGGKSQLPEAMVGKASEKFKATDTIWEFFAQHPMADRS